MAVCLTACASASEPAPELLIRTDDIGMNHTVNEALRQFIRTGIPFSATVMTPCPWFSEAAEILRNNPQVSVGIHLTLNSEWADYRWGPVLGASAVPTLVDRNGWFFHTGAELRANDADLAEVEAELRAQIRRALDAGLDVDFLDYHMLTAVSTPGLRDVVEKLAAEFEVGLSHYFGEPSASLWDVEPGQKLVALLDVVERVRPGLPTLLVMHLGQETPEMNALVDANNQADPYRVAKHRAAELDALTSPAFRSAVEARNLGFVTYGDMLERYGRASMRRPAEVGYSMGEAE
jgi:predicted glycoside hydrolase/deacetylase ChbG (UPF0249 family)